MTNKIEDKIEPDWSYYVSLLPNTGFIEEEPMEAAKEVLNLVKKIMFNYIDGRMTAQPKEDALQVIYKKISDCFKEITTEVDSIIQEHYKEPQKHEKN